MAENTRLMGKIDDLNEMRAVYKNSLKNLESKKHDMKPEKYKRQREKLEHRLEKTRVKIKKLEDELRL